MKKIFAIAMIAVMLLSMVACGAINKTDVVVLWSEEGQVKAPNSLINALERAMYIENIAYAHQGAEGNQATQTKQAETALNAGCAALVVELVEESAAQTIVDLAKAKNVPVVFFGCNVAEEVVRSYDKCVLVTSDEETTADTFSKMVLDFVAEKQKKEADFKKLDRDGDGKINYIAMGGVQFNGNETLVKIEGELEDLKSEIKTVEKPGLFGTTTEEQAVLKAKDDKVVELILTGNDELALQTMVCLQALGLNTDKLATHFVPVFTIGADADYKGYVVENMPESDTEAYLQALKHMADLTTVDKAKWPDMIYNTLDQIGAGRLCGTMMEDYDAIAEATAQVLADLLKGKTVAEPVVKVDYTTYVG